MGLASKIKTSMDNLDLYKLKSELEISCSGVYLALSSKKNPLCQIFEIPKKLKCNGYLVKFFEFSKILIMNVDYNCTLSLSVKVLSSY